MPGPFMTAKQADEVRALERRLNMPARVTMKGNSEEPYADIMAIFVDADEFHKHVYVLNPDGSEQRWDLVGWQGETNFSADD